MGLSACWKELLKEIVSQRNHSFAGMQQSCSLFLEPTQNLSIRAVVTLYSNTFGMRKLLSLHSQWDFYTILEEIQNKMCKLEPDCGVLSS